MSQSMIHNVLPHYLFYKEDLKGCNALLKADTLQNTLYSVHIIFWHRNPFLSPHNLHLELHILNNILYILLFYYNLYKYL